MNSPREEPAPTSSLFEQRPFRVGRAIVDPLSRDARWAGGEQRLQPQTLKVLLTLLRRRGEVVTREELVQRCWGGRIVGDDVINRSISLLRQFAERAGGFEIETVPRTGYRLIETAPSVAPRPKDRWIAAAFGTALVVALAGLAGWVFLGSRPIRQGLPPAPSISVVPFIAETSDPLVRQVARAAPISLEQMMSQSGFAVVRAPRGARETVQTDYIFSGNVRRTSTSLEATVQLVARRDGRIAFAHDFSAPFEQAADLPARIGATTASDLAWSGALMVLDPRKRLSPEIASELMTAISLTIEQHNNLRAYQLARHAAGLAPDSAIAQLTLAIQTAFSLSSIPRGERAGAVTLGRRAGDRARVLAPEFGDVYLTWCLLHSPVRMAECDARVRHALDVDPRSSFVPGYLSSLFYEAGRIDEALELAHQSLANDPYKPAKLARMIRMFEVTGRSDDAEEVYREARRLWPDDGRLRVARLLGMAERGNYSAIERFADPKLDAKMLDVPALRELVAAQRSGNSQGARRTCDTKGLMRFTMSLCMTVLADVRDLDRSFAIAANLYPASRAPTGSDEDRLWLDHPEVFAMAVLNAPAGKAMRTDRRFLAIAGKQGLLAYWRKAGLPDFCRQSRPEPICSQFGSDK